MSKTCVCIEGQLRGAKSCGPTIRKHLIEHLDADLYFVLQNYTQHDANKLKYYGINKGYFLYDNPEPDFTDIFNNLCKQYNYEIDLWKLNFNIIKDRNWSLGFNSPGTCIRRMFNRFLIYQQLKKTNYDWFILLRSDLYFVDYFFNINNLNCDRLYYYGEGGFDGINNNLLVFHRNLLDKVLIYIHNFLNLKLLATYILCSQTYRFAMNEEMFFMFNMDINNVQTEVLPSIKSFISADQDDITTWANINKGISGHLYKYDYDYQACLKYLQEGELND